MTFQERLNNIWKKTKSFIDKGIIQKFARISYDVVWNIILFFIVIGIIAFFFVGGIGAGYFASLVKDEPLRSQESMVSAIHNYEETSEIYFADEVYMGEVSSDIHREEVSLANVSDYIINGIIATEDEYFETHDGIVPKAIMRAMFQEVSGSATQTGGSTLTQQIIKNQLLTNEVSFDRKAKEIILALRLENFMEKDEILEAYLNIVPFGRNANGRNIAGVQTATQGIFGVDADDVNLAQAAFVAGLPQSPIVYSPFNNNGTLKDEDGLEAGLNRMQTVLLRMEQAGYITEEEREEAMAFDVVDSFSDRSPSAFEEYPYLTEEVRRRTEEIFIEYLAEEDGYTMEDLDANDELSEQYQIYASRELSQGGYKIHTTINKEMFDTFQDVAENFNNFGQDKTARNEQSGAVIMTQDPETGEDVPLVTPEQAGSILIDNSTGAIIAFVGGRDFEQDNQNYATRVRRSVGSTAKPLLVYAPAMELGVIQPGSIIADVNLDYGNGKGWPNNFTVGRYYGLVTARTALANSYNVSAASVFQDLQQETEAFTEFGEKMGLSHDKSAIHPSFAIGTYGSTIDENTNAYATFGNDGKYLESYMIETIESVDGEIIFEHESESVDVFSVQTNYLMVDMMRDVLTQGTGRTARSQLRNASVDWAGKTGTSNNAADNWFVATNPNVTLGTWIGYNYNQPLDDGYSGRTQSLWAALVNAATEVDPDLMAPSSRFSQPDNIVSRSFSLVSGHAPSEISQSLGLVGSDIFNAAYTPSSEDDSLIDGSYVIMDGEAVIAGSNTPEEFTQDDGVMFNPEWLSEMGYDQLDDISQLIPDNNSAWDAVEIPELVDIEDNGNNPNAPTSLSKSGNNLTWSAPSSQYVVGYRIYRADDPEDDFSLYDSTIDTDINVGSNSAVYHVVAVNYFGRESEPSSPYVDGEVDQDDDEDDDTDDDNNEDRNRNRNRGNRNNDHPSYRDEDEETEEDEDSQDVDDSEDSDEDNESDGSDDDGEQGDG
ncbi:transglycosylase domain-containing protein [Amphibacillus cookii]|uniref:transglycosylase domain-containing protein n=1 Tax=Amphibacillus cookii TaxID=767787 RepID=UPI00195E67D5|nr:transglycosylase domain-containing protein [Amphibacillus cookii]MBM7543002.1 penicillin-binding protein [Amphibacillus cookii]